MNLTTCQWVRAMILGPVLFFSFLEPQLLKNQSAIDIRSKGEPVFLDQGEKIDFSSFPEYGIYFLEDITVDQLTEETLPEDGEENRQETKTYSFDYKSMVLRWLDQTNEMVIRNLAEKIDPAYEKEKDVSFLQEKVYQALKKTKKVKRQSPNSQEVTSKPIFNQKSQEGVLLRKADVVKVYTVKISNENQRMIQLEGNVLLYFGDNSLQAERVVLNAKTKDIHAERQVILKINQDVLFGDRMIINLNKQVGYIFDVAGMQEELYFEGKLLKINRRGHYTVEDGWVTFSSNRDPYYTIEAIQFDTYGKDKSIYKSAWVYVHNQPFLWIPYFIRYPVSTGLEMIFGYTRREGYYALINMSFEPEVVNKVVVDFNVYEKLGLYLGIKNKNTILNNQYDLSLVGVHYTDNRVTRDKPEKLTYSHNTSPYINSVSSFRHKVEYSHQIDFTQKDSQIKSSLDFSLKHVSDPFISSTFPLALKHLDLEKIIQRHDRDESLFTASSSDKNHYNLKYNLSAPQTSLGINLDWTYLVYEDPNKKDASVDERYEMYLSQTTIPSINFENQGTIDPYVGNSDRPFYFNLGYQTALSYSGRSSYKDGVPKGKGSGLLTNVAPYELTKENYNLKLSAKLGRAFSIDKDQSSLIDFNLLWFDWEFVPAIYYQYTKQWEGKDYTSSDNRKDDREDHLFSFSISSTMNFNRSLPTFFDLNLVNRWSLEENRTVFRYEDKKDQNDDLLEEIERLNSNYSFSIELNFPSTFLKNQWGASYSYHNMLPVLNAKLITYTLRKGTSPEKIKEGKRYELDQYFSRDFSSSFSSTHKGYGFLYLKDLNYTLASSIQLKYNLMPVKDDQGNYLHTSFFDNALWHENRFTDFSGATSLTFNYKIWNWRNTFNYIFFRGGKLKKIDPILILYSTSSSIGYTRSGPLNEWFSWNSSSFSFNWGYHFQPDDYEKDQMSISFNNSFNVLQLFNIAISFSSSNPNSYLYFKTKADHLGKAKVNFFEDVFSAFGFLGVDSQRAALFKMGKTSVSIWHDLNDWFLSLSYVLSPITYNHGSFRGFYFDHQITFEVNLKTDRDPRGPREAARDPFFEKETKDFSPEGVKQ